MDYQAGSSGRGEGGPGATREEIVYCHACQNEWPKNAHNQGLVCPRCDSEATEIISGDNDPRDFNDIPSTPSSGDGFPPPIRSGSDSDPDEADIEEHLHQRPLGFQFQRSTWRHPNQAGQNARQPPDPADGDQVLHRFYELLNSFGAGVAAPSRPDPSENPRTPPRNFGGTPFGGFGNVRTFASRRGNGFTSFTIATGPIHVQGGGQARAGGRSPNEQGPGNDDFQSFFSDILNGAGPPQQPHGGDMPDQGVRMGAGPQNLATSLHQILNMLAPGNGQFGDAVYTQEALDRIISNIMETNPSSNAAPPASADAIGKLQRKKVDDEMLGPEGTAECTICIDELKKGEEVVYLSCKHWFHDTCVVMWLKEHNTCPICRTPIEETAADAGQGQAGPEGGDGTAPPGGGGGPPPHFGHGPPAGFPGGDGSRSWGSGGLPPPPSHRQFYWEPEYPRPSAQRDQQDAAGPGSLRFPAFPPRPSDIPSWSRQSSQRRHSMSPPAASPGNRTRQRSPTPRSWTHDHQQTAEGGASQAQGPGGGPLSWLRSRLSRSGPSDGPPPDGGPR